MKRLPTLLLVALTLAVPITLTADPRPPDLMDGAELKLALRKLQVVGSALYVAAHPDDENTAFLSWLVRDRLVRAGYLSVTRGDGGQNLLGTETGEALGVIRTQELLAARRIDGAEQFFTRALDFGFSKNANETLEIWEKERILSDVVWVIRRFRPDVIVTRFPPDARAGHGHHTASAMLAEEAFAAAADPARFPEQLKSVKPWQAKRILWNSFPQPDTARRDSTSTITIDLGAYNPLLASAYTEMAGRSRSMHKSQGFGAQERRGSIPNFFTLRAGAPLAGDLFGGVDLTWNRIPGGAKVGELLRAAERAFDPDHPAALLPKLLDAHAAMAALGDDPLVAVKRRELLEVVRSCAGLWIEAVAASPTATPGARVGVNLAVLNRSDAAITLESVELPGAAPAALASAGTGGPAPEGPRALESNRTVTVSRTVAIPDDAPYGEPYWLREPTRRGSFEVSPATLIGTPENAPMLTARVTLTIAGKRVVYEVPVSFRWVDPVQGERWRAFDIVPAATAHFDQGAYLFADAKPRTVRLTVQGADSAVSGVARLKLPDGWRAEPASAAFTLARGGGEQTLRFTVTPGAGPAAATIGAALEVGGRPLAARRMVKIDYPHIPVQTLLPPAAARLVRADVRIAGRNVGYLMGSGDQVPDALRQMGYTVTLLSDDDLESADLSRFDAIVAGVRAYNTRPRLRTLQPRLLDYVEKGGRMVVQYVTADDALKDRLGPFPFTVSRDRVTVEEAEMRMKDPASPVLSRPNRIGAADFAGWVQERGLYYANPWDPKYETPLSANDPGETPKDGGLLVARHGKGVFIYSGLAWFRQLPAGVPGAWRLFANLVSPEAPK